MRNMLIVLAVIVAAILVGAGLYFYGPSEMRETPETTPASALGAEEVGVGAVRFSVLAEGEHAVDVPERKNYAVYSQEDFARLWGMAYGDDAPALPAVDFDSRYVIGVFAGEKPSGGYSIAVTEVTDASASRSVAITLTSPGAQCVTSQAITSPFQFISVPASGRALARTDIEAIAACP